VGSVERSSSGFSSQQGSFLSSAGSFFSYPRVHGVMQAIGGGAEVLAGGAAIGASEGLMAPVGWPIVAHGLDQFNTGMRTMISGERQTSLTELALQNVGLSSEQASFANDVLSIGGTMGGAAITQANSLRNFPRFSFSGQLTNTIDPYQVFYSQSSIKNTFRNGMVLEDLVSSLKIVERKGVLYTLDNRRLEVFRRAGLKVPYRMATFEEITNESWKFSSKNGGVTIKIKQ